MPQLRAQALGERVNSDFIEVYLTLVSIIQGVALQNWAVLVVQEMKKAELWDWTLLGYLLVTGLLLIIVWHQYAWGVLSLRWIPRIRDAVIPFCIGAVEFVTIGFLETAQYERWTLAVAILGFIGWYAYRNSERNTVREDFTSEEVYRRFQAHFLLLKRMTLGYAVIFLGGLFAPREWMESWLWPIFLALGVGFYLWLSGRMWSREVEAIVEG